jgi:hypothetical protein
MIGLQVTETDKVQILKARPNLTKAQQRATSGVDHYPRLAVHPYQVRR